MSTVGRHQDATISYVRRGSLTYQARGKSTDLVPGSIIVAPPGVEYVCSHNHAAWAECISFRFAAELVEQVAWQRPVWQIGCLPPVAELMVFGALAQSARDGGVDLGLDEIGIALAARTAEIVSGTPARCNASRSGIDRRRAVDAALWIEAHSHEMVDLDVLSRQVGLSPYYFLRMFSSVVGITPHQYLI
ncbi:MAG TPA: hypothetical protein VFB37_03585, partial [Steroidobacteraceae bacterium]|nr:hypothetical protein [Steroidobacteraceae bacterium]